ncbi:MAG: flagellar export chaperone FliS [Candidatus Wallbacteria bacterium]|nr:flagellar export chaperone FliS [Candidatus Wallbacteria bacterium]
MQRALNYRDTKIQTASPGKLILLLYDGALRFSRTAMDKIAKGDIEGAHNNIIKTQNIVTELDLILDMQNGGEIAGNLRKLYNFILKHLVKANVEKNARCLEEVIHLIENLNEAWKTVVNKEELRSAPPTAPLAGVSFTG